MLRLIFLAHCLVAAACSEAMSRHKRAWIIDSFVIEEGHPGPFPYRLGKIRVDRKYQVYFDLYGQGVDEEPKGVLSVNRESGTLSVHKALDYEEWKLLKLTFEARKKDLSSDTKLGVEIVIRDINDNPPLFDRDLYEVSVNEETTQGSHILTVLAFDRDQRGTPNSTFHYEIQSVSPDRPEIEFSINRMGSISFKGCLDHEVAEKFTIVVQAKDHGEVVRLSSSTTVIVHVQDGNNHLPTFSGQTGPGKVKEGETRVSLLRLHVADKDVPYSKAWRARYNIDGDEGEHFKIETDPDTNDGILSVIKPLDFEEGAQRELSISVENEVPFFSCRVEEKTSSGPWRVDTNTEGGAGSGRPQTVRVSVEVEDVNKPPAFSVSIQEAMLEENAAIGTWVGRVTAVDPDTSNPRGFVYEVGHDPAGWVTVDPESGDITLVKTPDRESLHVANGVYTVLLHAVDDDEQPQTGTATLSIYVIDQNDNVPHPTSDFVDVCMAEGPVRTNIEAFDKDQVPFGGPFTFELIGDVEGKWSLNPSNGYSAGLIKEPGVFAGQYTIYLKIADLQGEFDIYNLSVTVCDCSVALNCRNRRGAAAQGAPGAMGIILASLLLLLFVLLMAVKMSCKKDFIAVQSGDCPGDTLLVSNIEKPGTDCKLHGNVSSDTTDMANMDISHHRDGKQQIISTIKQMEENFIQKYYWDTRRQNMFSYKWSKEWSTMNILDKMNSYNISEEALLKLLHWRLSSVQEKEEQQEDCPPHHYADEGGSDIVSELETITWSDNDSFQMTLEELDNKFNKLASVCKPDIQN